MIFGVAIGNIALGCAFAASYSILFGVIFQSARVVTIEAEEATDGNAVRECN